MAIVSIVLTLLYEQNALEKWEWC